MTEAEFKKGLNQMGLATRRVFEPDQEQFLYSKLNHIPGYIFTEIIDLYLNENPCPVNIIGYFRNKYDDIPKNKTGEYNSGVPAGEYTQKDQALFFDCLKTAMLLSSRNMLDYEGWVITFNNGWLNNHKGNRTNFLLGALDFLNIKKGERVD